MEIFAASTRYNFVIYLHTLMGYKRHFVADNVDVAPIWTTFSSSSILFARIGYVWLCYRRYQN